MRALKLLVVTSFSGLLFDSCDPCGNLDCNVSDFTGQFRIVSATDGRDLAFGPTKIYDATQIKFYSLQGTDTTFFDYQAIKYPSSSYDSILYVDFYPNPNTAYMRLSDGDVDTFAISYNSAKSKCCGIITKITNFRLNNQTDIPGRSGPQEIKK